jgi:hypothetical protein
MSETYAVDSLVHETDGAYLLEIEGLRYWIPKSVCEYTGDFVEVQSWYTMEEAEYDDPERPAMNFGDGFEL